MGNPDSATETPVLATFEIKSRPGANMEEALELQQSLHRLARETPSIGEIGASSWTNEDGTLLVMYTFKSMDALKTFVRHPDHVAAMKRGKEFFSSIRTQIATVEKHSERDFGA